ncbi:MAG: FtsX-like permease family protein [Candidatus Kerfeldbacteria bacterium]|nr:FtsX-like permease family protein [Candidatus Kerfeldbacteria bacterium]
MLAFFRAITFAAQNFWRNIWLSIVTVVILTLVVFFISVLFGVRTTADHALADVRSRVDISMFFVPEATEAEIFELQSRLERLPEVASVAYVSKDDALAAFREENAGDERIESALEAVGVNPLQASLVIKAKELEQYPQILSVVNDPVYEKLVEQDRAADAKITFIQDFSRFTRNLSRIGLWLTIVFSLIAVLVVFNTIRLTIHAYNREISIMKLVGASNAFIRAPFLIESVFYALIAIAIALGVVWLVLFVSADFLDRLFEGFDFSVASTLWSQFFTVFGPPALLMLLLSMVSSAAAVGRYLRV